MALQLGVGSVADGIGDLSKAIEIDPHAFNYRDRGKGYLLSKQFEKARLDLEEARKLDERDADTCYLLSELFEATSDERRAYEYLEKAKELGYIEQPDKGIG